MKLHKLNQWQLTKLLIAVRNVRSNAINGYFASTSFGICYNVAAQFDGTAFELSDYYLYTELFQGWPGLYEDVYPIKSEWDEDGHLLPLWEGEQLRLRLSLLAHMISKLEAIIADEMLCVPR